MRNSQLGSGRQLQGLAREVVEEVEERVLGERVEVDRAYLVHFREAFGYVTLSEVLHSSRRLDWWLTEVGINAPEWER